MGLLGDSLFNSKRNDCVPAMDQALSEAGHRAGPKAYPGCLCRPLQKGGKHSGANNGEGKLSWLCQQGS